MLDLQSAVEHVAKRSDGLLSIVAASFGAISTCVSLPYLEHDLRALMLWNPVLDLQRTFIEPSLPWGVENFGPRQALLSSQGFLLLDGTFEVGRVLFDEMRYHCPLERFVGSRVPALVVHGDRDSAVSYDISVAAAQTRGGCDFHTVAGLGSWVRQPGARGRGNRGDGVVVEPAIRGLTCGQFCGRRCKSRRVR